MTFLHFRDIHKDSLERFRVEMGKLATEIETNYWDSDFYRKIRDKVDLEIKPAMGLGLYHITCPKTNHHIMSTKELEEKQEEEMR